MKFPNRFWNRRGVLVTSFSTSEAAGTKFLNFNKQEERELVVEVKTVVVRLSRPGLSSPDIFFWPLIERVESVNPLKSGLHLSFLLSTLPVY